MTDPVYIIKECEPREKNLSRYRSLRQQQYQSSTARTQYNNVIHTTIRPLKSSSIVYNKSLKHHIDLRPFATSTVINNYRDDLQYPINTHTFIGSRKKPRRSISVTILPRHPSSLSQSSQKTRRNNNSNRITPQRDNHSEFKESLARSSKKKIIDNEHHIYTSDASFDRHGTIQEHHHSDQKKKKKCSHLCIIVSLLIGLLITITIIVVLTVLLIKPKTVTRSTNVELRWNSTGETIAGVTGQLGTAATYLNNPFGLAIDNVNTLYIAEYGGNRIQRWPIGASAGTIIAGQANITSGIGLSALSSPSGILLDSNSNLYIADSGNSRILFWPKDATSGRMIAGDGTLGNLSNQLCTSFGISRDWNSDTLYIADFGNHRIMRYVSNATSGNVVAGGNGGGTNSTQLYNPVSVFFDSLSNSLLIVNYAGYNVVRWKIGDNSWTLVAGSANQLSGNTSTLLNAPTGMILDPMGNMYVADTVNHRIQFFLSAQSVGATIAGVTNVVGNDSIRLNSPYTIALDNQLNLYVADTGNNRIQRFLRY